MTVSSRLVPSHRKLESSWRAKLCAQVGEGALDRCGLANLDAELEQLAIDARCAPEQVGRAHLTDQSRISAFVLGRPERRDRLNVKALAVLSDHGDLSKVRNLGSPRLFYH